MIYVLILLAIMLNAIITFAYTSTHAAQPASMWGLLSVNFLYFMGISQTGVVISGIFRISKSKWGKFFSRFGEIMTISYIPIGVVTYYIIYYGGTEHLFWWAQPGAAEAAHGHLSPWLDKDLYFWRNTGLMIFFYGVSIAYYVLARKEEFYERAHAPVPENIEKALNVMAGVVFLGYIALNTNISWDFGMMIIKHWESTIFPPFYWVGNIYAAAPFLFILGYCYIHKRTGKVLNKEHLDSMSIFILGFTLVWIYMFWSQHIVIIYGDMPALTTPLVKQMSGYYSKFFIAMMLAIFFIPFFAFLFRDIKMRLATHIIVGVVVCIGVWLSRYLMIMPVFENGASPAFATWTNLSLVVGGLASVIFSVLVFQKLFPEVAITTTPQGEPEKEHH